MPVYSFVAPWKNRFDGARAICHRGAQHEDSCRGLQARRELNAISSRVLLRFVFVAWCAVAFCSFARAQPSSARRVFAGRVTTDNGLPVGGAAITVRRAATGSAAFWGTVLYSDARGDFSYPDAEDGDYFITVEANGLARLIVQFALNEKSPFLSATLDRLATVSLRVLRLDGTPLASAPISVLMRERTRDESTLRRATTDSQGVVAFSEMTPGVISLRVIAPRLGYADLTDLKFAPGSSPAAIEARLQAGATLRITARETPQTKPATNDKTDSKTTDSKTVETAKVDAMKVDAARVIGSATVSLSLSDNGRLGSASLANLYDNTNGNLVTRDGEGATEITALAPGVYTVSLQRNNYEPAPAQTVEIKGTETASLQFEMKRTDKVVAPLVLAAQNAKGQALGNRDVFVTMEMMGTTPANKDNVVAYSWRSARTDALGRFVLYPVEVGRWRITPRIAAKPDAPANTDSVAAQMQTTTVAAPTATANTVNASVPVALTFSFAVE